MIDSHHHLWRYSAEEYPWIPPGSPLAQDQLLPELRAAAAEAGIDGTIVVQARQILEETDFLLELAERDPLIRGVVGWVPLAAPDLPEVLDRYASRTALRGVRHVLQDEPDGFFEGDDFNRGLAALANRDLRYDLLIFQRQIPAALAMVDRHLELPMILDHIAKPEARNGCVEEAWRKGMRELAKRDHLVGVKFSGLVTEFESRDIDPQTIRAYFHETLEIFGSDRVMFGTDWPVCLLRLDAMADWAKTVRHLAEELSENEAAAILAENAVRVYGLPGARKSTSARPS